MRNLIIGLLILFFVGCEGNFLGDGSSDAYKVEILENASQSEWRSANFKARSETFSDIRSLKDVKHLLSTIQARGVQLNIAWYRKGTANCGDLPVVVPSQLLIYVDVHSNLTGIAKYFEPIDGQADLFCPNSVHKIVPLQSFY